MPDINLLVTSLFVLIIAAIWLARRFIARAANAFIDKRISHIFDLKLEDKRFSNSSSIEKLRSEYALSNSRVLDLAKRESDYVLEAWGLLRVAFAEVAHVVKALKSYEDIRSLKDDDARITIKVHGLTDPQINEVLSEINPEKRQKAFQQYLDRHQFSEAESHVVNFNRYYMKHRVFFPDDIRKIFSDNMKPMWDALRSYEQKMEDPLSSSMGLIEASKFARNYSDILDPVEEALRRRFIPTSS